MCKLKKFNYEIFFWVALFGLIIYLFQNNILSADDEYCNFLEEDKISLWRHYFYGTWIMPFQNFILYYLPYKLSQFSFIPRINLQDWAQTVGVTFEASVITILMVYFSKFFKLFGVEKAVRLLSTFFIFIMFIYCMYRIQFIEFIIYTAFFRFIIPVVMMVIFLYYLYKLVINEKVNIYLLSLYAILMASASEESGVITIMSCVLLSVYAIFTKQEYTKKLIILTGFLIAGLLLLVLSPGFQDHVHFKLTETKENYLSTILGYVIPYTKVYVRQLFVYNKWAFTLFIILLFIPTNNEKYKSEKPFAVSLILSCLAFCYSLIFLGNTLNDSDFWIIHPDIYSIVYIVFLTILVVLSHNFLDFYAKTEKLKLLLITLIILFLPSFCMQASSLKSLISNIKDVTYLRDKLVLYYLQFQEDIVLPYAVYRDNIYKLQENMDINFFDFLNSSCDFYDFENHKKVSDLEFRNMLHNYYRYVYNFTNLPNNYNLIYMDGESSRMYLLNHGGNYNEISSHKYRFSDLDIK